MYLLDTNVLSELMRPQPNARVVAWVDQQLTSSLFISAITHAEIELALALLADGQRKQALRLLAHDAFEKFPGPCLTFDKSAAVHYAHIVANRIRSGRPIFVEDAQIASIALTHHLNLVSRNEKDFTDIPGLVVMNPWQEIL